MELKGGYKQTEVGVIPEDWEVGCLGELFDFCNGFNADREQYGKGLPFISTLDVLRFCHIRHNDILGKVLVKQGIDTYLVKKGDVLFTRTSETQEEIGTASVYIGEEPVTFGGFVIRGRQKTPYFFEQYLGYAFKNPYVRKQITSLGQGGIHVNIGQSELEKVYVPIPHASEQKAIACALSDVDALLSSLDALIAKKRDIKMAAMQELLTGKKRLPGFSGKYKKTEVGIIPKDWEVAAFGEVAQILRGGSPRPIEAYLTKSEDGYNWIKIGDVAPDAKYICATEEKIIKDGVTRSRRVYRGDLLLSNSMSFGRPYILQLDGCIHDGWLVIQNYQKKFDTDFLYYLLSSEVTLKQYRAKAAGSGVLNLNKELVASVILYSPPKAEQTAIAAVLSDMDAEISALEARRAKVLALKQGMMQELLTGRTRLLPEGE